MSMADLVQQSADAPTPDAAVEEDSQKQEYVDPDQAAYEAAVAEAEAEEAGNTPSASDEEGAAPSEPAKEDGQPPAASAEASEPEQEPSGQPGPVPYERFQEVTQQRRQAERDAAYWQGVAEARETMSRTPEGQPLAQPGTEQPAPPTPAEQIASLRQRLIGEAQKFDAGEITMTDLDNARMEIDDAIHRIRVDEMRAASQPAAVPQEVPLSDAHILQRQQEDLYQAHPHLGRMTEHQVKFLGDIALREFEAMGRPVPAGTRGTFILRQRVGQLSDFWGPQWFPGESSPTPEQPTGAEPTTPTVQGRGLSPEAQAKMDKIQMAQGFPPDSRSVGNPADSSFVATDAQLMALTEDQWAALPPATRERYLNGG